MNRDWLTEFPDAKTPGQTLSRVLQGFRDPDGLEFLDLDGTYRILNLDKEAMASPAKSDPEQPYEARIYETTVQARRLHPTLGGYEHQRFLALGRKFRRPRWLIARQCS